MKKQLRAVSIRKCKNCGERFRSVNNRKICSDECRSELLSKGQIKSQMEKSKKTGLSIRESSQQVSFLPTLEGIAEKCRLIRENRLVVGNGWHSIDGVKYDTQY